MDDQKFASREELERIRRVADQLCTAHASLRDRYARRALTLDICVLLGSAWLTSLAFIQPSLHQWIVPPNIEPTIWNGLIGFFIFCLVLIQLKTDWKSKAEAHSRSFGMYAEIKREAGYILASSEQVPLREFQRLTARYDMASDVGAGVPEREFLRLKKLHKRKVALSKALDDRPGTFLFVERLKITIRDNFAREKR